MSGYIHYSDSQKRIKNKYGRWAVTLASAGVLFSGYMSYVRFFTNSCVFSEPCPQFLGYPACYFGFAMFISLFFVSIVAVLTKTHIKGLMTANAVIAAVGTLFSGYFALNEPGISTCVYGAVFFIVILLVSVSALTRIVPGLQAIDGLQAK